MALPRLCLSALLVATTLVAAANGQPVTPTPNLAGNIDRPLRYRPDGTDFVITNGAEFFNRPLYGGNTGFRVDAGDKPEFTMYLPGRGGNLRMGFKTGAGTKWLFEAASVVSRYRPGVMLYEVRDPILGNGATLNVEVLALAASEGLMARVELQGSTAPVELVWAYGGVNGQRGARDGDIGTESVPISEYFQLKPEFCRNNTFAIDARGFTLSSTPATITGVAPAGTTLAVADANRWASWEQLAASGGGAPAALPVIIGRSALPPAQAVYLELQRTTATAPAAAADDLPAMFAAADDHFKELRQRVVIDTPDAYLNAAAGALNVAVDAVWDEQQGSVMHGAVAWRQRLLGWRGPYAQDALGWHDRAERNFLSWVPKQNLKPIPASLPPPDESSNLARSEAALHSNGDLSNSHYDMNAVFIDALFRHLEWTGDLDFARLMWPVIERHLAWEKRLFRRPFGPEGLPLYEAYAMIWASDDLGYSGGGVAHASAYNYAHNLAAAKLARLLGHDPAPYQAEATAIAAAMRKYLWLPDRGWFAEYKDLLGEQQVHPSAALWTFYLTMDSGVAMPDEAWYLTRYVDRELPHLPVRGPGVPADDDYHVLGTSNWMPYSWSINNVVMGEVVHTALGYWQAGRSDEANRLLKGSLLASMYMGICPGNIGSMDYLDVYRRESQRDFADGGGVLSRALVEGLFGIKPDALSGTLDVSPGFPATWDHAGIHHPEIDFAFRRMGKSDTYSIEPRFSKGLALTLKLPAFTDGAVVMVDGQPTSWMWDTSVVGPPRIVVTAAAGRHDIVVTWGGKPALWSPPRDIFNPPVARPEAPTDWTTPLPAGTKTEPVDLTSFFNDRVTQIFKNEYRTPRSPYASLGLPKQGIGAWAGHVNATAQIDDSGLRAAAGAANRFLMPNGLPFATPGTPDTKNIVFTSQWDNYPRSVTVPLRGSASQVYLLMAGSTDWMQSQVNNGEVVVTYTDGAKSTLSLKNPINWWPIDQDYFIDDYQFRFREAEPDIRGVEALPQRVDLKTGKVRLLSLASIKGQGGVIPGGSATVLELALDPAKTLQSLTVHAVANEIVVGLMAATLLR